MATIDASLIPPQFSSDGGTTWLTGICVKDWNLNGETPSNTIDTFCGPIVGLGTPGYTEGAASMVGEFAPSASQVSMELMQTWWFNKTALKFRAAYPNPAGTDFYVFGDAKIKSFNPTFAVNDPTSFDASWSIENLDITP